MYHSALLIMVVGATMAATVVGTATYPHGLLVLLTGTALFLFGAGLVLGYVFGDDDKRLRKIWKNKADR